jgi:hypothetical protein
VRTERRARDAALLESLELVGAESAFGPDQQQDRSLGAARARAIEPAQPRREIERRARMQRAHRGVRARVEQLLQAELGVQRRHPGAPALLARLAGRALEPSGARAR